MTYVGNLTGIAIFKGKHGVVKKRYLAIQVGADLYLHPKTYKRMIRCKSKSKKFMRILSRIKVKMSLPALEFGYQPVHFSLFGTGGQYFARYQF